MPNDIDRIAELLRQAKSIAVVGLSDSPLRISYDVSAYMQSQGYRIIPVNPKIAGALGERSYLSLSEVPEKIDIVNVFRRSVFVPAIVDEGNPAEVAGALVAGRRNPRRSSGKSAASGNLRGHGPLHSEGTPGAAAVAFSREW